MKSLKGFWSSKYASFLLTKKSTANSKVELAKINIDSVSTEAQSLKLSSQITNIATDLGSLKTPPADYFDPKIQPDECTEEMCGFNGECKY